MNAQMERYAIEYASLRARLLCTTAGFSTDEIDDARQELLFDCIRRFPKFDPSRGDGAGFIRGVMRNQASVLVVRRHRRTHHEILAGDLDPDCENPSAYFDTISDGDDDDATGLDVSMDVRRVLGKLPNHLRELAGLLPQMTVREICDIVGKSRSRVYQMIRQIRAALLEAGLERHVRERVRASLKSSDDLVMEPA